MKKSRGIFIKNEREIKLMRLANNIVARILKSLEEAIEPGVPTLIFEEIARAKCDEFNVKPAFLGYSGFPYALCCSVNEEVVHGFPSERILQEGDIVSFDMGVICEGFYGDAARTYPVGKVSEEAKKLIKVTEEALMFGISQAKANHFLSDVSAAIQEHVESFNYSVVKRFVGHGIGRTLHEKPEIPNYKIPGYLGPQLEAGMVLAIEPMVTVGSYEIEILADEWTAVTRDKSLSAHFEHTVAILSTGPEILSVC